MTRTQLEAVPEPAQPPVNDLTIDDLAREVGLSVRNLRSHQARGLLPPPEVRKRVGYYGPEHVARVRLVQELQGEGMKLEGIKKLLDASGATGEGLLRVKHAAEAFGDTESTEILSRDELREKFGQAEDEPKLIERATKLGLLTPVGDDLFEVTSPSLLAAAEEVVARGITLPHALELLGSLNRHSRSVSEKFVRMFVDDVWKPFAVSGQPDERWTEIAEAMDRLRPLAEEALLVVFRQTLSDEVESTFADIAKRLAQGKR
ncbi:MAG TPA: MerR family transcriptional regulator [Thermoleophilaceae bacterium]|jgi:DNA-binding transcriptional MerR regulator